MSLNPIKNVIAKTATRGWLSEEMEQNVGYAKTGFIQNAKKVNEVSCCSDERPLIASFYRDTNINHYLEHVITTQQKVLNCH